MRKYLRGAPDAEPRRRRDRKLAPFETQIQRWVEEDAESLTWNSYVKGRANVSPMNGAALRQGVVH